MKWLHGPRQDPAAVRSRRKPTMLLHIGLMKSGTSYLQDVLDANRSPLRAAGVRYLGRGTRAVWDIMNLRTKGNARGAWEALVVDATTAKEPLRLLSMEILSTADDDQVADIVASLEPLRVEVVLTARDLVRVIPSAWQNAIKHGGRPTFDTFVSAVMAPTADNNGARFWRQHDVASIAQRWADAVGPRNVHLVTLPPSGADPEVLWQRFCSVLGVDAAQFPPGPVRSDNPSLSFSDAELLRRLNRRLGGELGQAGYNRYVRTFLAHEVMRGSRDLQDGTSDLPSLDEHTYGWVVRRSEQLVAELADSGVDVVGSLTDLVPPDAPPEQFAGRQVEPLISYPETAVRAMATLLRKLAEMDPEIAAGLPPAGSGGPRRAGKQGRPGRRKARVEARRGAL